MPLLNIVGWRSRGLQKISMTHLLQDHVGLSLTEAKNATDRLLKGEAVSYNFIDVSKAEGLREALENIGAVVEIIPGKAGGSRHGK